MSTAERRGSKRGQFEYKEQEEAEEPRQLLKDEGPRVSSEIQNSCYTVWNIAHNFAFQTDIYSITKGFENVSLEKEPKYVTSWVTIKRL